MFLVVVSAAAGDMSCYFNFLFSFLLPLSRLPS